MTLQMRKTVNKLSAKGDTDERAAQSHQSPRNEHGTEIVGMTVLQNIVLIQMM